MRAPPLPPACAAPSLTLAAPPSALPAGSNSIGRSKWPAEVVAAQVFVQEFAGALPAPVRAGVVQFSGRGIGGGAAADSARLEVPLTAVNKTGSFREMTELQDPSRWKSGSTLFAPALTAAYQQFLAAGSNATEPPLKPFRGIVFVTDGANFDPSEYTVRDQSGVFAFCQQSGLVADAAGSCTFEQVSEYIKAQGLFVKGIFVGAGSRGEGQLCETSTCSASQCAQSPVGAGCALFTVVADLEGLRNASSKVASELIELVPSGTLQTGCNDPNYFAFLLMALPLAWYLLFLPVRNAWFRVMDARAEWTAVEVQRVKAQSGQQQQQQQQQQQHTAVVVEKQPVHVAPVMLPTADPDRPIGKRFKWKIEAADRYLWAMGGAGNAPLKVDFGGAAPPSAPKRHADQKQRVEVEPYEVGGEECEEPQQQPAMAVETKSAAEMLPRNDTQQEGTQEGWYLPPTWPSSAGGGICCCCSCFVSCAARFINDLAHFVAFYCECCVSRLGLIVDEHAERVQAQQQQQL